MANAAKIQKPIEDTGKAWATSNPPDQMMAASACPDALYAELAEQIAKKKECIKSGWVEGYACKAKSKKSASDAGTKTPTIKPTKSESSTPSIWEWGTGNPKKPSSLCVPAASVLMGILYGARDGEIRSHKTGTSTSNRPT